MYQSDTQVGGRTRIAEMFIKLREGRGWTQRRMAVACGATPAAIANVERGADTRPTAAFLEKVAYGCNVPLAPLLEAAGYDLGLTSDLEAGDWVKVPIIKRATVFTGTTLTREDNVMGYLPLSKDAVRDGHFFLFPISDDAMEDAGFLPGQSYALIKQQFACDDNQIVLVAIGDSDAVLRYVRKVGDQLVLSGARAGSDVKVVPLAVAHILGVAVEVITHKKL